MRRLRGYGRGLHLNNRGTGYVRQATFLRNRHRHAAGRQKPDGPGPGARIQRLPAGSLAVDYLDGMNAISWLKAWVQSAAEPRAQDAAHRAAR